MGSHGSIELIASRKLAILAPPPPLHRGPRLSPDESRALEANTGGILPPKSVIHPLLPPYADDLVNSSSRRQIGKRNRIPSASLHIHLKSANSVEDDQKLIATELSYIVVACGVGRSKAPSLA